MELVKKESFNLTLKGNFDYVFDIAESGLYLIEITASAKSWWQNLKSLRSFFNDDDLAMKLDGREFPKLKGKRGLFDGEAAWNGNNLKGAIKTCAIIISLNQGKHLLEFLSDVHPFLQTISVFRAEGEKIDYLQESNNPAQEGGRRQWLTVIVAGLGIKIVSIEAKADHLKDQDDDDLQLIIDGQIQPNGIENSHKNWYWCGKVLKGDKKTFEKDLKLRPGLHYIELWADKSPTVKNILLQLEKSGGSEDSTNDPIKIKEGFNPAYVLKDEAFANKDVMDENRIQAFLDVQHKNKDKSHLAVIKFDGEAAAFWIKKASDDNHVNPRLLLTKLQAEQRLVRGEKSATPKQDQLDWAMGVGVLDNGEKLSQFQGFSTQVTNAARLFRKFYEEAKAANLIHENVDGKPLATINAATYSLYKYTPHIDGAKLVYSIYAKWFGYDDLGGVISNQSRNTQSFRRLAVYVVILLASGLLGLMPRPAAHSEPNYKQPLYAYHAVTDLDDDWRWGVNLNIFSERDATWEDGLYCGFRFGKIYQSEAKVNLFFRGKLMDSLNLTDPELVFDPLSKNLFYYQPQDIDGDGRKAEFIISRYANCNGNWLEFVRANTVSGKIEKIPIHKEGTKNQFSLYADIGPNALQLNGGSVAVRSYNNADIKSMKVGFYRNSYQYQPASGQLVWQKIQNDWD